MRIAINCRSFLNKNYTGIGRYTYQLIQSLSEIDGKNEYLLYTPKRFLSTKRRIPQTPAKNFLLKIDRFYQGMEKIVGPVDITHCPSPESLSDMNASRIIVTVHDLIFKTYPQGHTQETIEETERQFNHIIEKASKIICCSKSTLNDLNRYFSVDPQKTVLIYQGVNPKDFYSLEKEEAKAAEMTIRSHGMDGPFILFVGTIEPRKNLRNILAAFSLLKKEKKYRGKLAIVGMQGWNENLSAVPRELDLKNDVVFTGFLSNCELRHFYNQAEVLAFPSFYEGFGFPILEAFSCGLPVVTSNVSSCPEIADAAALTVDPYSVPEIARALFSIIDDKNLREDLRQKGLKRSQQFSFLNTARQTLEVYKEVYENQRLLHCPQCP